MTYTSVQVASVWQIEWLNIAIHDIGIDKFFIQLLEEYPCDNIEQLRKREGEYIQELKPVLNTQIAGRTLQEWQC